MPADFVSSVLIASGRPAIVLPHIATTPAKLERVLIAWKPTRESARAVTAALPILQQARKVTVASFDEGVAAWRSYLLRTGARTPAEFGAFRRA